MKVYQLLERLTFGEEHDGTPTDDGWEVFTWMTDNHGAGFIPCKWMQIQIENDERGLVIIRNDIETQEQLECEIEDIKCALDKCHKL